MNWNSTSEIPHLEGIGAHVWAANLDSIPKAVPTFISLLSLDERQRAERFNSVHDHDRFIAARGVLRTILGFYLKKQPSELKFDCAAHGKPELLLAIGQPRLNFNLSHSEDLLLMAVSYCSPLGIDVEQILSIPDVLDVANRFFSKRESEWLRALPEKFRLETFYKLWTCKEACMKARGEALSEMLPEIDTASLSNPPVRLSNQLTNAPQATAPWTIEILKPSPASIATLAAPTSGLEISCYQWTFENIFRTIKSETTASS